MMSGPALGTARLAAGALAILALTVPAGAAVAHTTTSVQLSNVQLKASWKEGWLTANLHFTVKVDGATTVTAVVRPVAAGPVAANKAYSFGAAGSANETITLPPRLVPSSYTLKVGDTTTKFTVPAPPEGVVDSATISTTKGGKSQKTISGPKALWVRFHFLVPPTGAKTVKIVWRTPSFQFVGAVNKPYATTIDSTLASNAALPKGTWYALMYVNGKVAKRQDVRVA
jgi:hypothetical protein